MLLRMEDARLDQLSLLEEVRILLSGHKPRELTSNDAMPVWQLLVHKFDWTFSWGQCRKSGFTKAVSSALKVWLSQSSKLIWCSGLSLWMAWMSWINDYNFSKTNNLRDCYLWLWGTYTIAVKVNGVAVHGLTEYAVRERILGPHCSELTLFSRLTGNLQ